MRGSGTGGHTHGGEDDRQWTLQRTQQIALVTITAAASWLQRLQGRRRAQPSRRRGRLTEDGAGRIITGETGLAHTRTE